MLTLPEDQNKLNKIGAKAADFNITRLWHAYCIDLATIMPSVFLSMVSLWEIMREYSFFSAILGLSLDWRIENMAVDKQTGIIEIHLQNLGTEISYCTTCGIGPVSVSTRNARWLHENHLNFKFVISSKIPVLSCEHCGVVSQQVPWEKSGNSFRELVNA